LWIVTSVVVYVVLLLCGVEVPLWAKVAAEAVSTILLIAFIATAWANRP
jgi:hypothetical protein